MNPLSLLVICLAGGMNQIARNLTDASDGFLRGCRYLIQDRSSPFTEQFRSP